ncbi:MAG: FxsA family protein [Polyangiales bacterium]
MGKLLLLFTAVPLVELYLLLLVGSLLGFWPTVGIVLLTGMVGAWLAKSEGLRVLRRWQAALGEGRVPEEGVLDGLLVLVGGVLLVTPGVLTDVLGLALLVSPSRRAIARVVRRRVERKIEQGQIRVVSYGPGMGERPPEPRRRFIDAEGEEV